MNDLNSTNMTSEKMDLSDDLCIQSEEVFDLDGHKVSNFPICSSIESINTLTPGRTDFRHQKCPLECREFDLEQDRKDENLSTSPRFIRNNFRKGHFKSTTSSINFSLSPNSDENLKHHSV